MKMKKNKIKSIFVLGFSFDQAFSLFLIFLLLLVFLSLGSVVYLKGKHILSYIEEEQQKREVLGLKNKVSTFLENHLSVFKAYSKFSIFTHAVMQPEEQLSSLAEFMKDISFFGESYQVSLVDYRGRSLYSIKSNPVFDYTKEDSVIKVLNEELEDFLEISKASDNAYYWRLCVPVFYNGKIEGALILEIPVQGIMFRKQFEDMLHFSQLKISHKDKVIAVFGDNVEGVWDKSPLYKGNNVYLHYRINMKAVETLYRKSVLELVLFFFLLLIAAFAIAVRFARRIFVDPLHDFQKMTSKLMDGEQDISVSTSQKIYELRLLATNFKDMCFSVNSREDKLKREIEERKKIEIALDKSKQHFKHLIEITPFAIILINQKKEVVEINQSALSLLEIKSKDDIVGQTVCKYTCDNTGGLCPVCRAESAIDREETEVVTSLKNRVPVIKSTRNISMDGNSFVLQTFIDITARKKIEENNRNLESELHQARKLEAIGTLSAGIAHEINTPVQFVNDYVSFFGKVITRLFKLIDNYKETISKKTPEYVELFNSFDKEINIDFLRKETPDAIANSKEGLERISSIVKAMRDFSHAGVEGQKVYSDINKAIESTVTITKNEWKYVAEVKTELSPDLPQVLCFLGDIKQVILNIIVNAAHAIKEKIGDEISEKGLITIETKVEDDDMVLISVSDTGCGIRPEDQPKVFDQFFTTKEVGKGTGQGLSIGYAIVVQKHKGRIDFETVEGKGTTFFIRIPINIKK